LLLLLISMLLLLLLLLLWNGWGLGQGSSGLLPAC
jgi:hypothetical protein